VKQFLRKLSADVTGAFRKFLQPSPKTKIFKECQLEGLPNYRPSRGPRVLTCPWHIHIPGWPGCMDRPFVSSWCLQ